MSNYIITADTTFELSPQQVEQLGIVPIVSYVSLGDEMQDDFPDINASDVFAYVKKSGKLPQTAAANPGDYEEIFRSLREKDERPIIHIAKSSGTSSCCENAMIAAREVENVFVVDSENISGGQGVLVLRAARSSCESVQELLADLEAFKKRVDMSFVIETLEFLHRGGRCSGLAALGANLLKLRPEIVMEAGKMSPGKKYRGSYEKCLQAYLEERLQDVEQYDEASVWICHTLEDPQMLERMLDSIRGKNYFKEIICTSVCSAVATHCGPNTFGLILIRK